MAGECADPYQTGRIRAPDAGVSQPCGATRVGGPAAGGQCKAWSDLFPGHRDYFEHGRARRADGGVAGGGGARSYGLRPALYPALASDRAETYSERYRLQLRVDA